MNKTAIIHARIEPRTKSQAENILKKLGLTATEAIRLLYRQICLRDGLPFPIQIPNELTQRTLRKSARGENVESFATTRDMFKSWHE